MLDDGLGGLLELSVSINITGCAGAQPASPAGRSSGSGGRDQRWWEVVRDGGRDVIASSGGGLM
jgi:hypothetical protein